MTEPEPKDGEPGPAKKEQPQQSTGQLFDQAQAHANIAAALEGIKALLGGGGTKEAVPDADDEWLLARETAHRIAAKIVDLGIAELKAMTDCRASGDDSGLANVWEEVCAQVQGEHSIFLAAYEDIIESILFNAVTALNLIERQSLWLLTSNGEEWEREGDDKEKDIKDRSPPVFVDDIVDYLNELLLTSAADFENENIRNYLYDDVGNDDDEESEAEDDDSDFGIGDPPPDDAAFIQSNVEGRSLADVAHWLADNVAPADRATALKALDNLKALERCCVTLSFRLAHVTDRVPVELFTARSITAYTFGKAMSCVEVWVNGADVTGKVGVSYETLLHELVRASALSEGAGVLVGPEVTTDDDRRDYSYVENVGGRHTVDQQAVGRTVLT